MNKNRQTKLNNKKRKQGAAKKQELVQQKQQIARKGRDLEYQRNVRSHSSYLDSIAPKNSNGQRQIQSRSESAYLSLGWGMMLGMAGLFGDKVRVDTSRHITDRTNVIDHNPDEFKE